MPETNLDEIQKGLYGILKSPIYHFIKEFFHNHTHHHASQDSLLQAYASRDMVDLKEKYEEITLHYIHQYRALLIDFNEETSAQLVLLKKRLNHGRQVMRSINALGEIVKAGNDLNGQLGYMDFLIQKIARPSSIPSNHSTEDAVERAKQEIIKRDSVYFQRAADSIRNDVSKLKHCTIKRQKKAR